MKRETVLERKIEKIKHELVKIGEMRPGAVTTQTRKWGGEYGQLSYSHKGKGHTEYVPAQQRREVERQTENYKKFRKLTQEWVELGLELCKLKAKAQIDK